MAFSKIRIRGDIKTNWESANPILAEREWGVEWETTIGVGEVNIKIGNGSKAWNDLDYASVKNITKKIVSTFATISDANPTLNAGESLETLFGKIKKKFDYLASNKLDKSSKYDGLDSTSTDLYATANAVRQVNVKADKNASDITTLNSNLGKITNLNTSILDYALTLEKGLYCVNLNGSEYAADDLPSNKYAYSSALITVRFKKTSVIVVLLGDSNQQPIAINSTNNNTWVGWKKYNIWPDNPGTQISSGTDMKTITLPGYYYCEDNKTAASLKNCPLSEAFTLVVYRSAGSGTENIYYIAQEYTSYLCNRRVIQTYNKDSRNWTSHEIQFKS